MCIRILASFVLVFVVVNSTNCPPRRNRRYCSCWDREVPSGTIGLNCIIRNLTEIQALSTSGFSSHISRIIMTLYGIPNLTPMIFQFNSLEALSIYGKSLNSVHRDAFYGIRETLVSLIFVRTSLRQIPADAVYRLTQLKNLSLENGLISSLTHSLHNTSLETLTVSNNTISTIANGAFPPTLKYLYLKKNNLSSLNGALRQDLPYLVYVDISENEISSLYGVFDGTPHLHELYAESNIIVTIDDFSLAKVPYLVYLHLSYNRIREIHHGLNVLRYLTELELGHNHIETVNETAFQNCTLLNLLKLNNNRISQLPEGLFDCLTSLGVLDLSDNFLTNMYYLSPPNAGIQQNLESKTPICDFWKDLPLEVLDISGNDVVCDERTNIILQRMRSNDVFIAIDTC